MLTANNIDKKITTLLPSLSTKQKKALLSVAKSYVEEEKYWQDELFVKEMDRRTAEYESGETKCFTIDETIANARKAYAAKQKK